MNLWRHKKTGRLYEVICQGLLEATLEPVTVYQSRVDGRVWVRPSTEFLDGRFEPAEAEDDIYTTTVIRTRRRPGMPSKNPPVVKG